MDKITREELKELSAHSRELCVSLFMPAFRAGRETEQNPIRFKNLLKEAENRLSASGARPPEIQELLKPARSLVDDPLFWQHQGDGLAVFLSADYFKKYRLPSHSRNRSLLPAASTSHPCFPISPEKGGSTCLP